MFTLGCYGRVVTVLSSGKTKKLACLYSAHNLPILSITCLTFTFVWSGLLWHFWYTNISFQTYSCDVKSQCQLSLIQWECWVMSVKRNPWPWCGTSPTNWWDMLCYLVMSQTVCLSRITSVWWMFCWLVGLSSTHCCPSQCLSTQFPRHLTSPCASFLTEDDVRTGFSRSTQGMCLRTHNLMKDFTP